MEDRGSREDQENDHNLNVTLYVFPEEEREDIDIGKEWKELLQIEEKLKDVSSRLEEYLNELYY